MLLYMHYRLLKFRVSLFTTSLSNIKNVTFFSLQASEHLRIFKFQHLLSLKMNLLNNQSNHLETKGREMCLTFSAGIILERGST